MSLKFTLGGGKKPLPKPSVFEDDDEDEDEPNSKRQKSSQGALHTRSKRPPASCAQWFTAVLQRRASPAARLVPSTTSLIAAVRAAAGPPPAPADPEMTKVAEKLAAFVAKNGARAARCVPVQTILSF